MDFVNVLCDGTMKAFARLASRDIDLNIAIDILRTVIKERYDEVLADLNEAADAHVGDAWLHKALDVACADLAADALGRYAEQQVGP